MLKKTIKFEDFNGTETTEDFYFNLTKSEAILLEVARDGGKTFSDSLQNMIDSKSTKQLSDELKDLIKLAYGVRSTDGKRFEKSDEHFREFASSGAYHALILELLTDAQGAAHFINGIVPEELSQNPDDLVTAVTTRKTAREISEERMQGYNKKKGAVANTTKLIADPETTVKEGIVVSEAVPDEAPAEPKYSGPVEATSPAINFENTPMDPRASVNQELQQQYQQQGLRPRIR